MKRPLTLELGQRELHKELVNLTLLFRSWRPKDRFGLAIIKVGLYRMGHDGRLNSFH